MLAGLPAGHPAQRGHPDAHRNGHIDADAHGDAHADADSHTTTGEARRPWPDTQDGIHVFNDWLPPNPAAPAAGNSPPHGTTPGVQKMTRTDADTLPSYNPNLLIPPLSASAWGWATPSRTGTCQPTGEYLHVVEGNSWVQEWPGDGAVADAVACPLA